MNNLDVVKLAIKRLEENPEWKSKYEEHSSKMNLEKYKEDRGKFHKPKGLHVYTCISNVKGCEKYSKYDLRFEGRSVGTVTVEDGKVFLDTRGKENKKNFNFTDIIDKKVEWVDPVAKNFRKYFENPDTKSNKLQQERSVEEKLLDEFSKPTRASGKKLCNIQPVKLGSMFFQMPTPLSASHHSKGEMDIKYSGSAGGGIDILARIKDKSRKSKLAVIELKDKNTASEPQKEVMWQALAYATFVGHLLRSESGKYWWKEVFGINDELSGDKPLEIIVATLMPEPEKGCGCEGELDEIPIEELNVKLIPQTLYFKMDENMNPVQFSGTFKENLYKQGE